ncbi:hypothetical protein J2W30_002854 [Variovorax boronicumulans]|uniref:hypothetical protein n=1 Tax=Variovorax boronicumulans TaxID=436515 RepID=UPI002785D75B|nr:hypothetical protein [Variovorax boronicumulans]MDQ0035089.1 hypothetical protein [Variovorax boronicumulans]MDQ0040624.1 hypothetical protein [Variovorax boronicumulans]
MKEFHSRIGLLLSLQRALIGNVDLNLRQVSIEADVTRKLVKIRFEHERAIGTDARERLSLIATEIIADLPAAWSLEEQYSEAHDLLPLTYVGYRRFELKA